VSSRVTPQRVLVVRFSSAGDIVLCSALLRCIHRTWPNARVDMLVRSDMAELVSHNPNLNSIHTLDRTSGLQGLMQLARGLRARRYDLVIDLHNNLRSRLLGLMLGPRFKTIFGKKTIERWLVVHTRFHRGRLPKLLLERYFEPLEDYGVVYDGHGSEVHVSQNRKERIESMLAPFAGRPILGIAPGASYPKKAFPLERFAHIAQQIIEQTSAAVILFGGAGDPKPEIDAPGRMLDLQGTADMQEAALAASRCRVVLTNDSLMLHLAEAAGTDALAFFGPTTRDFGYFPWRPSSKVIEVDLACRPCSKHGQGRCKEKDQYCFSRIETGRVVDELKARLGGAA